MQTLELYADKLDKAARALPDVRRKALEQAGQKALERVRGRIGGAGKVQRWQDLHIGSGGGYSAVRAKAETYQVSKGGVKTAVGYITNAIESGHRARRPMGKSKRYQFRVNKKDNMPHLRIDGKHMYRDTKPDTDQLLKEAAGRVLEQVKAELEG